MTHIIEFFVFLLKMFRATLGFLLTVPGLIFSAITSLATGIVSIVQNVAGISDTIFTFFETVQTHGGRLLAVLQQNILFDFFYSLCAFDKLVDCITVFLGAAIVLAFLALFEIFFHGLTIAVPFFIYKAVARILQAVTVGYAKVG